MPKRFTDTEKYKKPFIRGLKGAYKLLWDYLYTTCDNAGIWIVDFEVAQIYLGSDMSVNRVDALRFFNAEEVRVVEFDGGKKWFLPSFITFQHGELSNSNPAHKKIIPVLRSLDFIDNSMHLKSSFQVPIQGTKVEVKVVVEDEVEEKVDVKEKPTSKLKEPAIRILEHYNVATGSRIVTTNPTWLKLVIQRLAEGISEPDMIDMLDYKSGEWTGQENEKHLVPATLFSLKHCANYVLQMNRAKEKGWSLAKIKGTKQPNGQKTSEELMEEIRIHRLKKQQL